MLASFMKMGKHLNAKVSSCDPISWISLSSEMELIVDKNLT